MSLAGRDKKIESETEDIVVREGSEDEKDF